MKHSTINTEEVAARMNNKFRETSPGWHNLVKTFMTSEELLKVVDSLVDLTNDGKRFTPPLKSVFRAFEECPLEDCKVVIVGSKPYVEFNVADGIAFSNALSLIKENELRNIHDAISETVNEGHPEAKDMERDLKIWSNQGVLLLNRSLTTQIDKGTSHTHIWENFVACLFDMLNHSRKKYIFVFMGEHAAGLSDMIDNTHHKLFTPYPFTENISTVWEHNDVFNKINVLLKEQGKKEIVW